MVWPAQLVTVALYETLHGGAREHQQQTRDRMRFFLLAFVAIFVRFPLSLIHSRVADGSGMGAGLAVHARRGVPDAHEHRDAVHHR